MGRQLAVITTQQAADRLPDTNESDGRRLVFDHRTFSHHVVEINQALRAGYRCANDNACVTPLPNPTSANGSRSGHENGNGTQSLSANLPLQANVIDLIRQQLRQGQHIGLAFADVRRFKVGSWQSGSTITSVHEAQVLTQVERLLANHPDVSVPVWLL